MAHGKTKQTKPDGVDWGHLLSSVDDILGQSEAVDAGPAGDRVVPRWGVSHLHGIELQEGLSQSHPAEQQVPGRDAQHTHKVSDWVFPRPIPTLRCYSTVTWCFSRPFTVNIFIPPNLTGLTATLYYYYYYYSSQIILNFLQSELNFGKVCLPLVSTPGVCNCSGKIRPNIPKLVVCVSLPSAKSSDPPSNAMFFSLAFLLSTYWMHIKDINTCAAIKLFNRTKYGHMKNTYLINQINQNLIYLVLLTHSNWNNPTAKSRT